VHVGKRYLEVTSSPLDAVAVDERRWRSDATGFFAFVPRWGQETMDGGLRDPNRGNPRFAGFL
jgi:hypothetical protein